jgi:hypothetical protein
MIGFLFRALFGAGKLAVKYVVIPAAVSVAVAFVAESLASQIRARTPQRPRRVRQAHLDAQPAFQ